MRKQKQAGFTLVELMIVVVIVAIITSVAYPAYTDQVQRTRQSEMQGRMADLAASMEAWKSQNFTYNGATIAQLAPNVANSNYYNVGLTLLNGGLGYQIDATPVGQQVGAGHLAIDSQGRTCHDPNGDAACDLTNTSLRWSK